MVEHDVFEDMDSRVHPDNWRNPRVVAVDRNSEGLLFWGEIGNDDRFWDTALTGKVLNPIQREIESGRNAGTVEVDGVEYAFIVNRIPPLKEQE